MRCDEALILQHGIKGLSATYGKQGGKIEWSYRLITVCIVLNR